MSEANIVETIARAMCEAQQYACTENELARALDEVPGFLADLQRAGLAIVPCEPTEAMIDAGYDSEDYEGWSGPLSCWERMINATTTEEI